MEYDTVFQNHEPWNKGKLIGQKSPLKRKEIWSNCITNSSNLANATSKFYYEQISGNFRINTLRKCKRSCLDETVGVNYKFSSYPSRWMYCFIYNSGILHKLLDAGTLTYGL